MDSLSIKQARRIALAAQGFIPTRRRGRRADRRHFDAVVNDLQLLQIDSVNVLERSHYLPLFSRLGDYRKSLLDEAVDGPPRKRGYFEYWAHEASILPLDMQPLFRWRMQDALDGVGPWKGIARFGHEKQSYVSEVLAMVRDQGPVRVADISGEEKRKGSWWGWQDSKIAMEWLFWTGRVTSSRRINFERHYDLTERVIPADIMNQPTPDPAEAHRRLLRLAAASLGIATEPDLRDYFRLSAAQSKPRVAELAEAGDLIPVTVQGWDQPAWLWRNYTLPGRATCRALLSPFDPLVWYRPRTERLFDFHYRLEIYTPAENRRFGYYVLPFLLGDSLVGRVDLKADRAAGVLRVRGAYSEASVRQDDVAMALAGELRLMADWLKLSDVAVERRGNLAPALRQCCHVQ
tara:strand:- start:8849 stop:10063 length:1215 start_codon:yes stop_codon:yes gene_type:complete